MTPTRPSYGRYLLGWCALWLLITVLTQLPECYERSLVSAPWKHRSVSSELLLNFASGRLLLEIPCGLLWGSLSWLLQRGTSAIVSRFFAFDSPPRGVWGRQWSNMAAVVVLASAEAVLLGAPLSYANTEFANFSRAMDYVPAVTITDRSIAIEAVGILLAFPLACLAAGCLSVGKRKPPAIVNDLAGQNGAWPPPPRSSM